MSQENVEIVRRVTEVMDDEGFEAAFPVFAKAASPDVEWREDPSWPGGGTYRGAEEIRRLMLDRLDSFEYEQQTEQLIDLDDKVVALVRWRGRGKASGARSDMELAIVWTLRERAIAYVDFYINRAEAFEAVGLSE
jgi:ketosteroid isomerase-like protein